MIIHQDMYGQALHASGCFTKSYMQQDMCGDKCCSFRRIAGPLTIVVGQLLHGWNVVSSEDGDAIAHAAGALESLARCLDRCK